MSEPDVELQKLQDQLAARLGHLGLVEASVVCRAAHKVIVRDRETGAFVRILICRDGAKTAPFVNITPILGDGDRTDLEAGRTFRGLNQGAKLLPLVLRSEEHTS